MKEYTGYPRGFSPPPAPASSCAARRAFDRGEARHEAQAHARVDAESARIARLAAAAALIAALEAED